MATVESLLSAAKQLSEVQQRKVAALVGAVVAEAAGKQQPLIARSFCEDTVPVAVGGRKQGAPGVRAWE